MMVVEDRETDAALGASGIVAVVISVDVETLP
jgi:hypothetical protein